MKTYLMLCAVTVSTCSAPMSLAQPEPDSCEQHSNFFPTADNASAGLVKSNVVWIPPESGNPGRYEWRTSVGLGTQQADSIPFVRREYDHWQWPAFGLMPDFQSACWFSLVNTLVTNNDEIYTPVKRANGYAEGFRLGINLLASPSPGDFLCPSPNVGGSSVALLPPGADTATTAWRGMGRPTIDGSVDLITGLPLVKVTDLELPLDGATFRLTRTRSGHHPTTGTSEGGAASAVAHIDGPDRWWDWVGQGWMASENPILLIDSALPDVTGGRARTTWLWLDALHSIPFQRVFHPGDAANGIPPTVSYEAPPRFRARMEHNGVWETPSTPGGQPHALLEQNEYGSWATRPTQFDIWLYDGLLHYTFVAIYEDVPPKVWDQNILLGPVQEGSAHNWGVSTYHHRGFTRKSFIDATEPHDERSELHNPYDPTTNPGFGIPHYGLCVKIEDQHGHSVEIGYSDVKRFSIDLDPLLPCAEYIQDVQAKGEIKYIKLKNSGATKWTLAYSHRRWRGFLWGTLQWSGQGWTSHNFVSASNLWDPYPPTAIPQFYEIHGHNAIDRIYVFEGDVNQASLDAAKLTIHHTEFDEHWLRSQDIEVAPMPNWDWGNIDPLTRSNEQNPGNELPTNWTHQVRYHYADTTDRDGIPSGTPNFALPPTLLKTTIRTRPASAQAASPPAPAADETVQRRLYVYDSLDGGGMHEHFAPWLRMIFEEDDLARLLDVAAARELDWWNEKQVAYWHDKPMSPGERPIMLAHWDEWGSRFASARWESAGGTWDATYGNKKYPPFDPLRTLGYLRSDEIGPVAWDDGHAGHTVGLFARGDRVHRVFRLLVPPDPTLYEGDSALITGAAVLANVQRGPGRSIFAHPFPWRADMTLFGAGGLSESTLEGYTEAPDLTEARWITIVDEFVAPRLTNPTSTEPPIYEDDESDVYYLNSTATKPGQLSRRVVEMNATGYVLRERGWQYTPDGVIETGGGLGAQRKYETVADYFTSRNVPIPVDMPDAVKDDVLLTHECSVGWSALELTPGTHDEQAEGLVTFHNYQLVYDASVPGGRRVEHAATGVQKGYAGPGAPPPSTTQYFAGRSMYVQPTPDNSLGFDGQTDATIHIEFVSPATSVGLGGLPPESMEGLTREFLLGLSEVGCRATVTITTRDLRNPHWYNPELSAPIPNEERRVVRTTVIGPPRQQVPDGEWYFPVQREWYDDEGNPTWSCTGLVRNPLAPAASSGSPDPWESLVFTFYQRADAFTDNGYAHGRPLHTVLDAAVPGTQDPPVLGSAPSSTVTFPAAGWPEPGWHRMPATGALNYVTSFVYDHHGLSDTYFPNGRRWARRIVRIEKDLMLEACAHCPEYVSREYVFNDLKLATQSGTQGWITLSPGEIRDYHSLKPVGAPDKHRVEFTGFIPMEEIPSDATLPHNRMAFARLAVDGSGRLQRAELLEFNEQLGYVAVGHKEVNDLGEVYRELDTDGNITRITKNFLGQPLRRYVGTHDQGWVAPTNSSNETLPYNMVLTERTEYGTDFTNAWLPTVVREYRDNEGDSLDPQSWYRQHHDDPPAASGDLAGAATVTKYDWRMRPVSVQRFPRGNYQQLEPESTTLTYLDHAGRMRLTVVFPRGTVTGLTSANDPLQIITADSAPDVTPFLDGTVLPRPISITGTDYTSTGDAYAEHDYDLGWFGPTSEEPAPPRHTTHHYQGTGGQETFTQRPGQPIELRTYDATARLTSTRMVAPRDTSNPDHRYSYEISRTDFTYDGDGNVIETARWERVFNTTDPASDALGPANAVRSRTVSWFDDRKRLLASLDLGTEDAQNRYVYAPAAFVRPTLGPEFNEDRTGIVIPSGFPASAPLTVYAYNRRGEQTHIRNPNGSVTRLEYSPAGRLVARIENALDLDPAKIRRTEYTNSLGRVTEIKASRTQTEHELTKVQYRNAQILDPSFNLLTENHALVRTMRLPDPVSGNPSDSASPDIFLRYTLAGQIAERTDARGIAFRYRYDDFGRLTSTEVGHYILPSSSSITGAPGDPSTFIPGYPASMDAPSTTPGATPPRMAFVEYSYDSAGRLRDTVAFTARDPVSGHGTGSVIAHNRNLYDVRGNLIADYQSIGAPILEDPGDFNGDGVVNPDDMGDYINCYFAETANPGSCPAADLNGDSSTDPDDMGDFVNAFFGPRLDYPHTQYVWARENTAENLAAHPNQLGYSRLTDITYPTHAGITMSPRNVPLTYDGSFLDSLFSRVTAINDSHSANIATFEYTGTGRRAAMWLGHVPATQQTAATYAIAQTLRPAAGDPVIGLPGLDAWGRLANLEYRNAAGGGLYRGQYSYDPSGNRVAADVTLATTSSPLTAFSRESSAYDLLDRLVSSQYETLANPSTGPPYVTGTPRTDTWRMDLLGNWVGDTAGTLPGRQIGGSSAIAQLDSTGATHLTQAVDARNRINTLTRGNTGGSASVTPAYDPTGSLTFDGDYAYQYDAWGRLVQVNRAHRNVGDGSVVLDELLKRYTYDGHGRLVQTESPRPEPENANAAASDVPLRIERFYYDGIRRLQEVVHDLAAPVAAGQPRAVDDTFLSREYIWGPGDGPAGVDELLAQFEGPSPDNAANPAAANKPWWTLQDASGDLIAQCETEAPAQAGGTPPPTRVVAQWTYDPYGTVLSADTLHPCPTLHAGHKGLMLDALDQPSITTGGTTSPRLVAFSDSLYHVRNRAYLPRLGRWLQSDPNATGVGVIESVASYGSDLAISIKPLSLAGLHTDGANLYGYLTNNPAGRRDPLGLYGTREWWDDTQEGAGVAWNGVQTLTAGADVGGYIHGMLKAIVTNYGMNQDSDLDWASDWRQADDGHSRTDAKWIDQAILLSTYNHFNLNYWFHFADRPSSPQANMASAGVILGAAGESAATIVGKLRHLKSGMVFKSYYMGKAVKAMMALGSKWDAHHLLPYSWAKLLGLNTNGPAVLLMKAAHQPITTSLNAILWQLKALPADQRKAAAWRALKREYAKHPEWLDAIRPLFEGAP